MQRAAVFLALAAAFSLGVLSCYAVMQYSQKISNTARIKVVGVGVYKDVSFTVSLTKIDWGVLEPGESRNVSAYIKNESNVPITLTMLVDEWNPPTAEAYISLSWNLEGATLPVEGYAEAVFTLHVSLETSGIQGFTFTITVIGEG